MNKGQYHILSELLLIMIGILMTTYVVSIFTGLQSSATTVAAADNFNLVSDHILNSVVKVSTAPNAVERITIPQKVAQNGYRVYLDGTNNMIHVVSTKDSKLNSTKQIFNIGKLNRIVNSEVISSAIYVDVISESGNIRIRRG